MLISGVVLGVLVGAGIGLAVANAVVRRVQAEARAEREATVLERDAASAQMAATLGAELAADLAADLAVERERMMQTLLRQFSAERDAAMQATIDTVISVAGDKLGSHTTAASTEIGLRSEAIDQKIGGMNDELRRVGQLVTSLQKEKAEQHGQIVNGINEAVKASSALTQTTQSLREALSNSRARGQWGERMAEDVLRSAGFVEGINYRKQQTVAGGGRPDLTFLLPRDRVLHMDVKFPIDNYLRHLDAETVAERDQCAKIFLKDVRGRIKELTLREYRDADTTVGYVLLFIPNESVYSFIHEHDPGLLDFALGQQVVMCSPFTLFAVLGVVRQAVDNHLLERTSDEILECLNGFTKQWEMFSEKLDRLGAQFATAHKSYDDLAGTRRRQLQKQLDKVDRLRSVRSVDELEEVAELERSSGNRVTGELRETDDVEGRVLVGGHYDVPVDPGYGGEFELRIAK